MAIASRERAIAVPRVQRPSGRFGAGAVLAPRLPDSDDHTDQGLLVYHPPGRGPESSRVTDGSDFLPYPEQRWIDHNEDVSVGLGRRLRTMADAAQMKGQAGFGSNTRLSPKRSEGSGRPLVVVCIGSDGRALRV
jgi:hypothetical protein